MPKIMKEADFALYLNGYERAIYRHMSVKTKRLIRHMAACGLFYDPINSYRGCLYFYHGTEYAVPPMQLKNWQEVREYINGCCFE